MESLDSAEYKYDSNRTTVNDNMLNRGFFDESANIFKRL